MKSTAHAMETYGVLLDTPEMKTGFSWFIKMEQTNKLVNEIDDIGHVPREI